VVTRRALERAALARSFEERTKQAGKECSQVVRVSIEVCGSTTRFRVGVQDNSIERAVNLINGSYSAGNVRLDFTPDLVEIFVEDVGAQAEQVAFEDPQKTVA
jgi:hypothetical protein